jgi:hypothetical protein
MADRCPGKDFQALASGRGLDVTISESLYDWLSPGLHGKVSLKAIVEIYPNQPVPLGEYKAQAQVL